METAYTTRRSISPFNVVGSILTAIAVVRIYREVTNSRFRGIVEHCLEYWDENIRHPIITFLTTHRLGLFTIFPPEMYILMAAIFGVTARSALHFKGTRAALSFLKVYAVTFGAMFFWALTANNSPFTYAINGSYSWYLWIFILFIITVISSIPFFIYSNIFGGWVFVRELVASILNKKTCTDMSTEMRAASGGYYKTIFLYTSASTVIAALTILLGAYGA